MKKWFIYFPLPLVALILELLPWGAVCNFANPEGKPWRRTYSYFDLTPFGYANFAPLITAILTCAILLLLIVFCITGKERLLSVIKAVLAVATVISLCPLLFGISFFSLIGALISVALALETLLLHFTQKKEIP